MPNDETTTPALPEPRLVRTEDVEQALVEALELFAEPEFLLELTPGGFAIFRLGPEQCDTIRAALLLASSDRAALIPQPRSRLVERLAQGRA